LGPLNRFSDEGFQPECLFGIHRRVSGLVICHDYADPGWL